MAPPESTAILELRMAARHTGADEHKAVRAARGLAATLGLEEDDVADALIDQLLHGLALADAIAALPLGDQPPRCG